MGVDGVVLWGSSGYYREKHQCMRLQAWVQAKLGPYAKSLTSFLSDCSYTLCGGHGRLAGTFCACVCVGAFVSLYVCVYVFVVIFMHVPSYVYM